MFYISTGVVDFAAAKGAARGDYHKCPFINEHTPWLVVFEDISDVR